MAATKEHLCVCEREIYKSLQQTCVDFLCEFLFVKTVHFKIRTLQPDLNDNGLIDPEKNAVFARVQS